jgi:hypothetical protein
MRIPGDTEFTRTRGLTIEARDLMRWICAAFVTEYAWIGLSVFIIWLGGRVNACGCESWTPAQ